MLAAILGRLKPRAQSALLAKTGFRAAETDAALGLEEAALRAQKELISRRRDAPIEAYKFMEKLPLEQTAWLLAESSKSKALSRIRAYLQKWRPLRQGIPTVAAELEKLGLAHGPKFDAVIEQCFAMQLTGKGKTPEERVKILRKLAGIKEPPKKKIEEKKKKTLKVADKPHAPAADRAALPAPSAGGAIAAPGGTAAPARAVSKVGDKKPARPAKKARPTKKKSRRK
jgi:hypothetical protein